MLNRVFQRHLCRDGLSSWSPLAMKFCTGNVPTTPTNTPANPSTLILDPKTKSNTRDDKINIAMKAYLERASAHEQFMKDRTAEYNLGKRHLANMMGWDPEHVTQGEIDAAIEYLLPSGLFERKCRPMMKPPERIYKRQKAAEFDNTGRPFDYLFYTFQPNYYGLLHRAVDEIMRLDKIQEKAFEKGIKIAPESEKYDHKGRWLFHNDLKRRCIEHLSDEQYDYFVRVLDRILQHPFSSRAADFIEEFTVVDKHITTTSAVVPLQHDDAGNPFSIGRGIRKDSYAIVRVTGNGSGKCVLNGCINVVSYFAAVKDRIQIMMPLQFVGLLNKVDLDITVYRKHDEFHVAEMAGKPEEEMMAIRKPLMKGEGLMSEAGAIRLALAKALCAFVEEDDIELMRLAGLLTLDLRSKERKKPGQEGARRKYPWKKR